MGTGTVKKKKTNHTEETGIRVVRRRILQEIVREILSLPRSGG